MNKDIIADGETIIHTQKMSIFRILTNTNLNVILIVCFVILCLQYLLPGYKDFLVPLLALQGGLLAVIIIITVYDYKTSYFFITDKRVLYLLASQKSKKWVDLQYIDIKKVYVSSYNAIIIDNKDKKFKLEALSNPQKIAKLIQTRMKKA